MRKNVINSIHQSSLYYHGQQAVRNHQHSIDLSNRLTGFIAEQKQNKSSTVEEDENDVLGELQFAFVCFLIGNCLDAFEQWKLMVNLLCNSEEAVRSRPGLYVNLVNVLYFSSMKCLSIFSPTLRPPEFSRP